MLSLRINEETLYVQMTHALRNDVVVRHGTLRGVAMMEEPLKHRSPLGITTLSCVHLTTHFVNTPTHKLWQKLEARDIGVQYEDKLQPLSERQMT